MSAFPSIDYDYGSREEWLEERDVRRGTDGSARVRNFWPGKKKAFSVRFLNITDAEKASIEAHYDAHRALAFDFTWKDGLTYSVVYGKQALRPEPAKGNHWNLEVRLEPA